MYRPLALLSLLLLVACPRRGPVDVVDPLVQATASIDEAWSVRDSIGLDAVESELSAAAVRHGDEPAIRWRSARSHIARGLTAEDRVGELRAYSQARADALACLEQNPRFAQRRLSEGWSEALHELQEEQLACVGWAAWAWVRWLGSHGGEAGALDLAIIDALMGGVGDLERLEGGPPALWLRGLLAAVRPDERRDLSRARILLRQALVQAPGELSIRVDLLLHVAIPTEDGALRAQQIRLLGEATADSPEDRRALLRVADLPMR